MNLSLPHMGGYLVQPILWHRTVRGPGGVARGALRWAGSGHVGGGCHRVGDHLRLPHCRQGPWSWGGGRPSGDGNAGHAGQGVSKTRRELRQPGLGRPRALEMSLNFFKHVSKSLVASLSRALCSLKAHVRSGKAFWRSGLRQSNCLPELNGFWLTLS